MFSFSLALVGFFALALGPQAALSFFHSVSFAPVQQCGQFSVLFSGGKPPAALPLALTVLPFNSTPLSITLGDTTWDPETQIGASISFLPLPAGSKFVASLDDANGESAGRVSDVLTVESSTDSACLPTTQSTANRFTVENTPSECDSFQVSFNPSVANAPSTVRAFTPNGLSFHFKQSSASTTPGTATYTSDGSFELPPNLQVVLLLNDTAGLTESTGLVNLDGTVSKSTCVQSSALSSKTALSSVATPAASVTDSSPEATIQTSTPASFSSPTASIIYTTASDAGTATSMPASSASASMSATNGYTMKAAMSKGLSKGALIAIGVVAGSVVGGLAFAMIFWLYCHRRKSGAATSPDTTQPQGAEKVSVYPAIRSSFKQSGASRPPRTYTPSLYSNGVSARDTGSRYVRNPPYTQAGLINSTTRTSLVSRSSGIASVVRSMPSSRGGSTRTSNGNSRVASALEILSPMMSRPSSGNAASGVLRPPRTRSFSRRNPNSPTSSISSGDIAHILDMATMFGAADSSELGIPPLPAPVMIGSDTLRSSAYLAGRESARNSLALGEQEVRPTGRLLAALAATESLYYPQSAATFATFREPPRAPLPHSPMPSPLSSPLPAGMSSQAAKGRDASSPERSEEMYSLDLDEPRPEMFQMLRPSNMQRSGDSRGQS